ncbi:MAG: hypothetical protein OEY49_16780, partial [Candidatus Heimdallarchaeota archaeon]|nr:hypothetical protein [Candidatus Heimdallarchaeota archaeon]
TFGIWGFALNIAIAGLIRGLTKTDKTGQQSVNSQYSIPALISILNTIIIYFFTLQYMVFLGYIYSITFYLVAGIFTLITKVTAHLVGDFIGMLVIS